MKFTPHLQRTPKERAAWAATIIFGHIKQLPDSDLSTLKIFIDDEISRRSSSAPQGGQS